MNLTKPEEVGFCSTRLGRITETMQRYIDDGQTAGFVTLVARNGRLVHHHAQGYQDLASQKPMALDTIFRIYSMTKPITSVALMMLWEQGKVRLTDPISRFLPVFKETPVYIGQGKTVPAESEPTIQDLLRHTSGLSYGDFENPPPIDDQYPKSDIMFTHEISSTDFVNGLAKLPYVYQPGTSWRYSAATDVIGHIVELISGMSLEDFFREKIFAPLGMVDTSFLIPQEKADRFASLYFQTEQHPMTPAPPSFVTSYFEGKFFGGGGGLAGTAIDYLQFAQLILNKGELNGVRLLGRKTVEFMTQNHLTDEMLPFVLGEPNLGKGFGLGFSVVMDPAQTAVVNSVGNHGWGGWASTNFWVDPQEQLIGIIMTQLIPSGNFYTNDDFRTAVYQALIEN
ncbi:MAG: serine hydrolase domain-containing protein [Chloroflexota bacterium]